MKRIALMVIGVLALGGCDGDDGWKPTCSATKPCEAGNYCAETPDGNVCWPDGVAPVVTSVQAACGASSRCRRDGTLHVEVEVTDDAKMGTVEAELSLDPGHPRTLARATGAAYAADIPLVDLPFPHFEAPLTVSVSARDEAGNTAAGEDVLTVTREAWRTQLSSVPLWSPAVMSDGRVVVAASNGRLHFVSKAGVASEPVTVTSSLLNGPAAIGPTAVWVGSEDGRLYPVSATGTVGTSCNAGAAMFGAAVISGSRAICATKSSFVAVADAAGACNSTAAASPAQPVVNKAGRVFVPSSGKLRCYSIAVNGALVDEWTDAPPAPSVGEVTAPPAIDDLGSVWTVASGTIHRTAENGTTQVIALTPALPTSGGGGILLADGSAIFAGGSGEVLRRSAESGWGSSAALSGRPAIPLALTGAEPAALLVTTSNGWVHLLSRQDGAAIWSSRIASTGLDSPNIWTEPDAPTSTAYLAGADGFLYAVIVDGHLDTSAPWPKAYHDPQNTSNAGARP